MPTTDSRNSSQVINTTIYATLKPPCTNTDSLVSEKKWIISPIIGGGCLGGLVFMLFSPSSVKDKNEGSLLSKTISPGRR